MNLKHLLIILAMVFSQSVFAQQREHTVERGETLASIAAKYGLTEAQLKAANPNMTMCFAGVRLVIPDPNAPAPSEGEAADSSDKARKDKSSEAADSTQKKKKGFSKFLNSAGKTLGKAAKVAGNVATAVVVSKVKGDSWFDAINNAIESADSTLSGGTNEHGINSLLTTRDAKKRGKGEKVRDLVDDAKQSAGKVKEGIDELMEEKMDPELEALYNEYKAKYDDYVGQLEKLKNTYSKANDVAKKRTWKTVSDTVKNFKTQLEKFRTECEMYTGKEIPTSALEAWMPIAPKQKAK